MACRRPPGSYARDGRCCRRSRDARLGSTMMAQGVTSMLVRCSAIQPVELLGRPGSITCSQREPPIPIEREITGRVVTAPVIGRRAASTLRCVRGRVGPKVHGVRGEQHREFLRGLDVTGRARRCLHPQPPRGRSACGQQGTRQPARGPRWSARHERERRTPARVGWVLCEFMCEFMASAGWESARPQLRIDSLSP